MYRGILNLPVMKPERRWPRWFVIIGCILLLAFSILYYTTSQSMNKNTPSKILSPKSSESQDQEKKQIDEWITGQNLNEYGDPKDTVYTGGTPLFDESTGNSIDRYDYIRQKHPDKPWKTTKK